MVNELARVKCSLLIPCYNAGPFLPRLINSALNQTQHFFEIICYDDASTDNTVEVAETLGVKVIRGEVNRGPSFARNALLKAASGDWVHFHDADDILSSSFLEEMVKQISTPDIQIICDCGWNEQNNSIITYRIKPGDDAIAYFLNKIGLAIVGLYNKDFLLNNGITFRSHLRYNEDPDFHMQIAFANGKFKSVNQTLVSIIGHEQSASIKSWWSCISNQIFCYNQYVQKQLSKQHKDIAARKMADLAYYALRNKQYSVGYRAVYSLKMNFKNEFTFSSRKLNFFCSILSPNLFFKIVKLITR